MSKRFERKIEFIWEQVKTSPRRDLPKLVETSPNMKKIG